MSEKRKLRTIEMKRLTVEEFHQADKLPLVVVLDDVRSLYNYSIEQVEGSTKLHRLKEKKREHTKYAVILGNEVKGVHQSVVDLSDDCLEIQQYGTKHSLNVSVTAGIVIWEFVNMLQHSEPSSHCPTGQEHHPDTDGTIPDGNYNTKA